MNIKRIAFIFVVLLMLFSCSAKDQRVVTEGIATGALFDENASPSTTMRDSAKVGLASGFLFETIPWLFKDRSERPTRGTQSYEIMEENDSIRD